MGEVFKARDTRLDRTVAVKILPAALAAGPQFRERFDREARAISQLTHPHICTLYDVGKHDGTAFLVVELLDGETLQHRLTRGLLDAASSIEVLMAIADGLAAARAAAQRALDLDPSIAEAHSVLGVVAATYDYDWVEAERRFRSAMAVQSVGPDVRSLYALFYLLPIGHRYEALEQVQYLLKEDPVNVRSRESLAVCLMATLVLQRLRPDVNPHPFSSGPELAVECRQRDFCADRLLPGQGRRELHRVIPAQRGVPSEGFRPGHERLRYRHLGEVRPLTRERALRLPPLVRFDDPHPDGFGQGGGHLRSTHQ